jgi:hypothetical protein
MVGETMQNTNMPFPWSDVMNNLFSATAGEQRSTASAPLFEGKAYCHSIIPLVMLIP